jgi:hypothetical protein
MKALVYKGPFEVLRLPTSCICGSDLRVHRAQEGVADHPGEDLRATYLTSAPAGVSA